MTHTSPTTPPPTYEAIYEPPPLEITITLALGLTVLSPYYRAFARGLALQGDERVLDYGSGSGILSRHIAAQLARGGGQLTCVDVSRGWQRVIRRTLRRFDNVSYRLGRITVLDLPAASYDRIVVHFVLHEVPASQRSSVMEALAHLTKPGGRIVMREPQGHGLTATEIRALAGDVGLSVTRMAEEKLPVGAVYDAVLIR